MEVLQKAVWLLAFTEPTYGQVPVMSPDTERDLLLYGSAVVMMWLLHAQGCLVFFCSSLYHQPLWTHLSDFQSGSYLAGFFVIILRIQDCVHLKYANLGLAVP